MSLLVATGQHFCTAGRKGEILPSLKASAWPGKKRGSFNSRPREAACPHWAITGDLFPEQSQPGHTGLSFWSPPEAKPLRATAQRRCFGHLIFLGSVLSPIQTGTVWQLSWWKEMSTGWPPLEICPARAVCVLMFLTQRWYCCWGRKCDLSVTQAGSDQKLFFCSVKVDLKVQEYSNTIWDSRISPKQGDACHQRTEEFRVILAVSS